MRIVGSIIIVLALAPLLTSFAGGSNVYTVDCTGAGKGDFQDLQVALDSVPDGSVLRLFGYSPPVEVHHSVTIAGGYVVFRSDTDVGKGPGIYTAAMWIDAPDARVELRNCNVGDLRGPTGSVPHYGITIGNAASVAFFGCSVSGTFACQADTSDLYLDPPNAVEVSGPLGALLVEGGRLIGGDGTDEQDWNGPSWSGWNGDDTIVGGRGGAALDATGARGATLFEVDVFDGHGGAVHWKGDHEPTELRGGDAGVYLVGNVASVRCRFFGAPGGGFVNDYDPTFGQDGASAPHR